MKAVLLSLLCIGLATGNMYHVTIAGLKDVKITTTVEFNFEVDGADAGTV